MARNLLSAGDRDRSSSSSGAGLPGRKTNAYTLAAYSIAIALILFVTNLVQATDYVGFDNDDVMRLIEIRDLLNGQAWMDMMQYRMGLAGGTLMHWSRFVDLPIASLIAFFRLFASPERAEALALIVWPLTLAATIVGLMGLAGLRAGGRTALHVASGMTALLIFGMGRFEPGSIDHHNVQLTLAALILAMLLDPERRAKSFAIAGAAAAMSLAIGAETVPFVASVCVAVACLWAWHGPALGRAASAFWLALVLTVAFAFFTTTPPHLYGMVTCDNLSLGLYSIASIGGFLLLVATGAFSAAARPLRFMLLVDIGFVALVAAWVIAPQCLGNPLAGLDPMLVHLWLDKVTEAQPVLTEIRNNPQLSGRYYAVGLLAIIACVWRIARRDKTEIHLVFLGLAVATYGIGLIQLRGVMFANLMAVLPLTLVVTDLRTWRDMKPESVWRTCSYLGAALLSLPLVWSLPAILFPTASAKMQTSIDPEAVSCASPEALMPLSTAPAGVVMAPADLGVAILRYTPHRILSAPYHRNQAGMLAALKAAISKPSETMALLRDADVDYIVFCSDNAQTIDLAALAPDGLYGQLMKGNIPAYLTPFGTARSNMRIYEVKLD